MAVYPPSTYNTAARHDACPIRSKEHLAMAVCAVARGDKAAFTLVYAKTASKLFGIIMRIVRRKEVAEDVLQEVYLRIWQHADAFDPRGGSPITWMATIARNCALDEVRHKGLALPIDECPEVLRLAGEDGVLISDKSDASRDLAAALQRLSPEKRAILLQAYCYGLTREEIAERLGRPVPTVKTWLRRALAELKGCLLEQEIVQPPRHQGRVLAVIKHPEAALAIQVASQL
jgi:RNA polymerase sigma-70 factor (ECF subfamily)